VGSTSGRFALPPGTQILFELRASKDTDHYRVTKAAAAEDFGEIMSALRRGELREETKIGYGESLEMQAAGKQRELEFVFQILSSQRAEGGIMLDERLAHYFSFDYKELQHIAEEIEVAVSVDKLLLLSTAILLNVLETRFAPLSRAWWGMAQKSRDWFMGFVKRGAPKIRGRDLMAWVDEFVRTRVSPRLGA